MNLNSNTVSKHDTNKLRKMITPLDCIDNPEAFKSYFNVSSIRYNIITNRQKKNTVSMPKLVAIENKANKLKTFIQYWNNENFFDPIRNSKDKFENYKQPMTRKKTEFDITKYAKNTPLPVIKVLKQHRLGK